MPVLTPTRPSSPPGPARALRSTTVRGDERAFAELYERHHQALYRYCRSILRDEHDAQDALQNTMLKAFAALETEQRDFELRPWLFRIAHNEAISVMRRRRQTDELPVHSPDGGPSLWEQVSEREDVRLLREDLALLADQQRAALVLRELSGLGHAEIAQVLDSSPRAVKQTIFEARATLLEFREGRGMACEGIRRTLSDGDGRSLRSRRLRAHVRSCAGCRAFQESLRERPKTLAALAPPLPLAVGGSLLHHLVGAAPGPAAAAAGGPAAGVAGSAVAGGLATKIAAAVVVAVTAAGGATAVVRQDGGS
ncbi:MAG: RNA polymerase sigma factor, partial [Solirubrobacteraceae bacterium]